MNTILWLFLGFLLGLVFVRVVGKRTRDGRFLLGGGLVVGAWIYVPLALTSNADARWLIVEIIGAAIFTLMAWAGIRYSIWWLALGWGTHIIWDVGLHLVGSGAFISSWYPFLCMAFDLVAAAYISFFMSRQNRAIVPHK